LAFHIAWAGGVSAPDAREMTKGPAAAVDLLTPLSFGALRGSLESMGILSAPAGNGVWSDHAKPPGLSYLWCRGRIGP